MFTVQNDWIEYEEAQAAAVRLQPVPACRVAVRGGAACAQRLPVTAAPRVVPGAPRAAARPVVARPVAARPVAQPQSRLRLTRRGRVVLVVLPALLALSGALLAASPGAAEAAPRQVPRTVVVGAGDTLWSIAERIAPDADPRTTVRAIEHANGLGGAELAAGSVLVLPAGR